MELVDSILLPQPWLSRAREVGRQSLICFGKNKPAAQPSFSSDRPLARCPASTVSKVEIQPQPEAVRPHRPDDNAAVGQFSVLETRPGALRTASEGNFREGLARIVEQKAEDQLNMNWSVSLQPP